MLLHVLVGQYIVSQHLLERYYVSIPEQNSMTPYFSALPVPKQFPLGLVVEQFLFSIVLTGMDITVPHEAHVTNHTSHLIWPASLLILPLLSLNLVINAWHFSY